MIVLLACLLALSVLCVTVVAKLKADKAAAARMAADKEPLLKFLPGTLNQTQECLENIFREYDGDGSLEIDSSELRALIDEQLIAHGILLDDSDMEQRDINIIMRALDVDGDKTLSMDEFVRWSTEGMKRSTEDHALYAASGHIQATLAAFVSALRSTVTVNINKNKKNIPPPPPPPPRNSKSAVTL